VIGVLTVDDTDVFRGAAHDVIAATPGFEPLAEVASGAEAIDAAQQVLPDLVLLDVRMPGMNGIETARHLTALGTGAALVRKQDFRPSVLRSLWDAHGR
jgi:DNA-binding NarL/FixJ family response regulator